MMTLNSKEFNKSKLIASIIITIIISLIKKSKIYIAQLTPKETEESPNISPLILTHFHFKKIDINLNIFFNKKINYFFF
jgi:hypothetical protein